MACAPATTEWFHHILPAKHPKTNCNPARKPLGGCLTYDTVDEPGFQEEEWENGFVINTEEGERGGSGKGVQVEDIEDDYDRETRMAGESTIGEKGNIIIGPRRTQLHEVQSDGASGGNGNQESQARSGVDPTPTAEDLTPINDVEEWASRPRISIGPGTQLDSWHTSILESLGGRISPVNSEDSDQPHYMIDRAGGFAKPTAPRWFAAREEPSDTEAQEESLRAREREVNKQQTKLLGWERRLAELEEKLNKTEMGFWSREDKIKKGELDVARKERQIKELGDTLTIKNEQVEASAKAIAERESRLKERERIAEEREKNWDEREQALKPEEDRMTQRMLIWEDNWKKLTIRKKELQSLEVRLQQRQLGLEYRENKVTEREKQAGQLPAPVQAQSGVDEREITERTERIIAREKIVAEWESQVKEKDEALEKREEELEERTRKWGEDWEILRRREEELKESKAKWVEKWNVLSLQERELEVRMTEHEEDVERFCQSKEEELGMHMENVKLLEEREKDIQAKERELDRRCTSISNTEQALEARKAELGARLSQLDSGLDYGAHFAEGGIRMKQRANNVLKREESVTKRESAVLQRETAVAARESAVAERELMVITDIREKRLSEGREWGGIPGWRQSGRPKVQIQSPYLGPSTSMMADIDIYTTGINTPAGTSVYGGEDNINVLQGAVDLSEAEEDDLLTY